MDCGLTVKNNVMMVTSMTLMVVILNVVLNKITSVYCLINCHQVLLCVSTPKTSQSMYWQLRKTHHPTNCTFSSILVLTVSNNGHKNPSSIFWDPLRLSIPIQAASCKYLLKRWVCRITRMQWQVRWNWSLITDNTISKAVNSSSTSDLIRPTSQLWEISLLRQICWWNSTHKAMVFTCTITQLTLTGLRVSSTHWVA